MSKVGGLIFSYSLFPCRCYDTWQFAGIPERVFEGFSRACCRPAPAGVSLVDGWSQLQRGGFIQCEKWKLDSKFPSCPFLFNSQLSSGCFSLVTLGVRLLFKNSTKMPPILFALSQPGTEFSFLCVVYVVFALIPSLSDLASWGCVLEDRK